MLIQEDSYGRVDKLADVPFYTEGPAVDSEGNLYCTTLSGGSILKVKPNGEIIEWAQSERPNGQIILPNGDHLICDGNLSAIRRFDKNGQFVRNEIEIFCSGGKIYAPSDLVADASENIYFTDSIRYKGRVYFLGKDGQQHILADNLDYPNGLILSKNQKRLYVAESYKNRISVIDLEPPGKATGIIHVLATLPQNKPGQYNLPDGLTLDDYGNIWVAHYGMQAIQVLSPKGKLLCTLNTGLPLTSNLVFINKKTLFITGGFGEPSPGAILKYFLKG